MTQKTSSSTASSTRINYLPLRGCEARKSKIFLCEKFFLRCSAILNFPCSFVLFSSACGPSTAGLWVCVDVCLCFGDDFPKQKTLNGELFSSFFIPARLMNFCDNSWKVGSRRYRAFTRKASLQSDTADVTIVSSQTVLLSLKRLQKRKNFATTSTDVPPKGCSFTIPVRRVYFRGTCFLFSLLNRFLCYQTSVPIPSLQRSADFMFRLSMFPSLTNTPKQIKKKQQADEAVDVCVPGFIAFLGGMRTDRGCKKTIFDFAICSKLYLMFFYSAGE